MASTAKTTDRKIIGMEKKNPEILFLDSEAKNLYYASAAADNRIAIICYGGTIILNREQMYALCKEGMTIFNTYSGRGNRQTNATARRKNEQKNGGMQT